MQAAADRDVEILPRAARVMEVPVVACRLALTAQLACCAVTIVLMADERGRWVGIEDEKQDGWIVRW